MAARKKVSKKARGSPKQAAKRRGKKAKTRVKVNAEAEYAAMMRKRGVADVVKLSNDEALSNIRGRVSTQSIALDSLLCNPSEPEWWAGIPLSRVTEIFGPPSIGKSTLLDHIFASCQRMGGIAVLADTEISRDRHYVDRIGVDTDKLQNLEFAAGKVHIENVIKAFLHTIEWWKDNYPDQLVVMGWDALGSTSTKDSWDKAMDFGGKETVSKTGEVKQTKSNKPGAAAKAMNEASRQLAPRLGGTNIALVIVNHEYEMIRTGFAARFAGKKRETYGGSGVRHLDTLRLKMHGLGKSIKASNGQFMGNMAGVTLIKNRLGSSGITAEVPILEGRGVDNLYTLFEDLKAKGVIVTSGSWSAINLDGEVLKFQGWGGLSEKCVEDETLYPRLLSVWGQATDNPFVTAQKEGE